MLHDTRKFYLANVFQELLDNNVDSRLIVLLFEDFAKDSNTNVTIAFRNYVRRIFNLELQRNTDTNAMRFIDGFQEVSVTNPFMSNSLGVLGNVC